jgi:hypothetical protein
MIFITILLKSLQYFFYQLTNTKMIQYSSTIIFISHEFLNDLQQISID